MTSNSEYSNDYPIARRCYYIFLLILAMLTLIFVIYQFHPFPIILQRRPCVVYEKLHLYCPGCMGTHALIAFMNLQLIKSAAYNPLVIITAFLMGRYLLEGGYTFLIKRDGNLHFRLGRKDIYIGLILFLIFGIVRDLLLVTGIYDYSEKLIHYWT